MPRVAFPPSSDTVFGRVPHAAAVAVSSNPAAAAPSLAAAIVSAAVAPIAGSSVLALFLAPAAVVFSVAAAAAVVAVGASTVGAAPAPVVVLRPCSCSSFPKIYDFPRIKNQSPPQDSNRAPIQITQALVLEPCLPVKRGV